MTFPYKVTVKGKGNDVNVKVEPPPVATKPEFAEYITKRVHEVILANSSQKNTWRNRQFFKHQLTSVLEQLHAQHMIEPRKEKDEGNL